MLKYILGFVAGVAGLFIGVSIAVLLTKEAGTLSSALGAGLAIGLAGGVYKFFKKREDKAAFEKEVTPVISAGEKLKFEEAFGLIDCESAEIIEVIVMPGNEGMYSYKVGMRTPIFDDIEPQLTREELYKFFPTYTKFDFVDLSNESMSWRLLARGTKIRISPTKQTPAG